MQETQVMVAEEQRGTAARSTFYLVLSKLFFYPRNPEPAAVQVQALTQIMRDNMPDLPYGSAAIDELKLLLDELEMIAGTTPLPPLVDTYSALFDNCKGRSVVSLYEKDYGNGEAKIVWEELVRFYEHFGLNFDVRHCHDWPDHIGTELEFMHYLTFLEATVPEAERDVYLRGQKDFLSRRLGRWVSRFAAQLDKVAENAPYGLFGRLMQVFVALETTYLYSPVNHHQVEHWVPLRQSMDDASLAS